MESVSTPGKSLSIIFDLYSYARAMMKGYKLESIPEPLFYQSVRISRDVDHRNVLEVNREFRPLFVRPYDTLVMVTQGI